MDPSSHPTATFQPTASDFKRALLQVRDSKTNPDTWSLWVDLLKAQLRKPGNTITAADLAETTGLKTYREANLRYGGLASAIAKQLGYTPPERARGDRKPMWWMALSTGEVRDQEEGNFEFTMHPALAETLREMRWG